MTELTKVALRARLHERRLGRDRDQRIHDSAALLGHLLRHPLWQHARGVAAFVGVRGEPDTWGLLAATLAERKRLWLPRMEGTPPRIAFVPVHDLEVLTAAKFGLHEPREIPGQTTLASPSAAAGIDLVLVPGLGFGRDGRRLGFGKGHYDRALAPLRDHAAPARVGVCFTDDLDPEDGQIPMHDHDVPVHWVLTPMGLHACGATPR